MAQQNLNLGTTPNDGTGDILRCAFIKTETNFTDVYSCISGIDTSISNINSCLTDLDNLIDSYELFSWGCNSFAQLGTNNTTNYSTPAQEFCGGTNWCTVSGSGFHTSAIKTDGTLWSWGSNGSGRLGTNNTTNYSTPAQEACGGTNWCMVSNGIEHTSAIKTDGTLWSWGNYNNGILGLNDNTTRYSTPAQEFCGGTNWCMVIATSVRTSAIKTDGTLWSWGNNFYGNLGTNNKTTYSKPTQEFCGGTNWCVVSGGSIHTLAIKTDGTLWSWGGNSFGQLGKNNTTWYSSPTQEICGGTNWCMVSGGNSHSLAIKTNGTLWSWGLNSFGQLGTNDITSYSTPTQEVCGGTNWCSVSGGCTHTSALKVNGTLWSWGSNYSGELGINNIIDYSSPQQESCGGTNWCMISALGDHTSAIRID